ncbi:glycosyl hydrolase family 28-related protein [Novipirellula herctigrandis]|uniref:glycosyl hydrolase family 28-related protein n=1 Tax=Novipirellula herctigrandis TaxID=2527986 RepID=UPI003AF3A370
MHRTIWVIVATAFVLHFSSRAGSAAEFYDASVETRAVVKDLESDYGASGLGKQDDSAKLQQAIDFVSSHGGGVVTIPKGRYLLADVHVKSNVHVEIDKDVVITPMIVRLNKSVAIFKLGSEDEAVRNVSVKGVGGKYTVNMPKHEPGVMLVSFSNVRNFMVSNCHVNDQLTKFASLQFGPSGLKRGQRAVPTSGTVQNVSVAGAHYGYGVVQVQAAKSVLFENLSGVGGVSLRLESGYSLMNDVQYGGIDNIVGRNIQCTDGNAAVMISPHSMENGVFHMDGITSKGCGIGVRIEGGFISKKQKVDGLPIGTFAKGSSVKNVFATFGTNGQLKSKHFKYMPVELLGQVQPREQSEDGESVRGPSIAAVVYAANYEVHIENVTAKGFQHVPSVMTEKDAREVSASKKPKKGAANRGNAN